MAQVAFLLRGMSVQTEQLMNIISTGKDGAKFARERQKEDHKIPIYHNNSIIKAKGKTTSKLLRKYERNKIRTFQTKQ